ncbi:MAG: HAMP domain-containing protein, partial [Myxococcota bacterium]|nr:HAMP domain-containing protein [Myxococcota bacterium]
MKTLGPGFQRPKGFLRRDLRLSMGARFALAALVVLSGVFLVVYFGLVGRERARLVASKAAAGGMLADVFARSLQGPLEFRDEDAIAAEMRNLDGNRAIRAVVVWADDAQPVARQGELAAVPRPIGNHVQVGKNRIALAREVQSRAGGVIGEVFIDMSLDDELATYQRTRIELLVAATVMALGTSALLVAVVRREIVVPLRKVAVAATAIGEGQLTARAESNRRDEIGDLATAFNQMAGALEDREQRLDAVTQNLRELVDHMRQAIVAFDSDGRVASEASREALRLFGSRDLRGRPVRDLLYANALAFDVEVEAFDEWRELAFQTAPEDWDKLTELAPQELALGPEKIPVTLEFRPILRQGRVLHVMLLATDISQERRLERAVQTKDEEYARRMKAMRRLLTGGSQTLVAFVEGAHGRLAEALEVIGKCKDALPTASIDALFRAVHTVRGEARAFDMRDLERETQQLEEVLDELRADARGDGHPLPDTLRTQLVDSFRTALATLQLERDLFAEASPVGRAIFTQTTVQTEDLLAIAAYAQKVGGEAARLVDRLRARPLGESVAGVLESAPTWAASEGKRVEVVVEHGDLSIEPALVAVLPGVLTHLVRNSIAHGIETPEERHAAGKAADGVIRISASKDARGANPVFVEDDGRGL